MSRSVTIRVSPEERDRIVEFAEDHGITMSEVIRRAIAHAIREGSQ